MIELSAEQWEVINWLVAHGAPQPVATKKEIVNYPGGSYPLHLIRFRTQKDDSGGGPYFDGWFDVPVICTFPHLAMRDIELDTGAKMRYEVYPTPTVPLPVPRPIGEPDPVRPGMFQDADKDEAFRVGAVWTDIDGRRFIKRKFYSWFSAYYRWEQLI